MANLHVLLLILAAASALYSKDSAVVHLNANNFDELVLKSKDIWLIEFYAPWCGHCKNLAPEYEKAAQALKGMLKLGAVDMTTDQSVGSKYNIQGFPTIKFFGENKSSPTDYDSGRNSKDIVNFMMQKAQQIANKRLGVKAESNSGSEKPRQEQQHQQQQQNEDVNDDDVIVLTDSNFDSTVLASDDLWFVEFYAPWCGHCKKLAPDWAKAASQAKGSVKFGKVDATENSGLAGKYGVKGYPTLKFFIPGASQPEDYNGGRDASILVKEAFAKLDTLGKGPSMKQLVSEKVLTETCQDAVCILVFLPHIYDSSANERNRYIDVLSDVAKGYRGQPIRFLWVQAGDFYKLETMIGLGFGFPSVVALSLSKNRFALMRSAYISEEIQTFIRKILAGGIPLTEYKELPKIKSVEPWDGLDHVLEASNEDL